MAEIFLVAQDYAKAEELILSATELAQGITEEVGVLRAKGYLSVARGELDAGRQEYAEASKAVDKSEYLSIPQRIRDGFDIDTEMFWSASERSAGQCDEARRHFDNAWAIYKGLMPNPLMDQQFNALRGFLQGC